MADFPFDAVLFDCDGVLVDSEPITNRVLTEMLGELGWHLSVEETMRIFVGKMVKDEAELIEAHTGFALTAEWLAQFRARRNVALDNELRAIDGASFAVHALHQTLNGRIAVASGADRIKIELQLVKPSCSTASTDASSAATKCRAANRFPTSTSPRPRHWASSRHAAR
ncbi:beta-phosphoglucomutase-like phosphatase (HAD superfamily) [Paraburkholderia atlantica]